MKLINHSTNCQSLINENGETLFSYGVPVVRLSSPGFKFGAVLGEKWDFSRTTAKHVSTFLEMSAKEIREGIKKGKYKVENLEV